MNYPEPQSNRPRVLLIDDDEELTTLLSDYLERDGFATACAGDGASGADAALSGNFDIVVLDVMMPLVDGFQALARIRSSSNVPVIMLTARGDDADRIAGLEYGADDYVSKPCSPRELAARVRAILKRLHASDRQSGGPLQVLKAGGLCLWPGQRRAEDDGVPVPLTSTEFDLLELLMRHAGRPVGKAELSQEALGRPLARFDRSIDVHVHSIRNKLKPASDGRSRIVTVIRKGYQMIAD